MTRNLCPSDLIATANENLPMQFKYLPRVFNDMLTGLNNETNAANVASAQDFRYLLIEYNIILNYLSHALPIVSTVNC